MLMSADHVVNECSFYDRVLLVKGHLDAGTICEQTTMLEFEEIKPFIYVLFDLLSDVPN